MGMLGKSKSMKLIDRNVKSLSTETRKKMNLRTLDEFIYIKDLSTLVRLINVLHALFNFGPTSTLHGLTWPCTFIDF